MRIQKPQFDPRQQAEIGRRLRRLYDEVVAQEIPEPLQALLDDLDDRFETKHSGSR